MTNGSAIGPATVVVGNVRGEGDLEILGRIEGNVEVTGDLSLADGATVTGNISARSLRIAGAVEGDLEATVSLAIEQSARVRGSMTAPRIGIADGAALRGKVRAGSMEADGPTRREEAVAVASPGRPRPSEGDRVAAPLAKLRSVGDKHPPPPVLPRFGKLKGKQKAKKR